MTGATDYIPPANGWRTFLIVWVTQSCSMFGSALTFFAINIWLTQVQYPRPEQRPELAFALSAVALATALPMVFGAPLAGAWADRHDRRRTMIAMNLASGCLTLIIIALLMTGHLQLWMLLILIALLFICDAFHSSAFNSSYAMLVPERLLPRANGMMQTMLSLSGILAPALAASLIALPALARQGLAPSLIGQLADGTWLALAIDAITFFIAALVLCWLTIPSPSRADLKLCAGPPQSFWDDIREGALYIWKRRPLLWLLGMMTLRNFVAAPLVVLEPLMVKLNLAADWPARGLTFETALALLGSVASIGGVIGGLWISAWGGLKARRVYGVLAPMGIAGAAQVIFGLSPLLYLSAAMLFILDAMIPILNAHSQTIWQTQTPHDLQGRVFAVRRLMAQCSWPLGTMLAGWAGGIVNPGLLLAALGALLAVVSGMQLFNPYFLRVEDKVWLDDLATRRAVTAE